MKFYLKSLPFIFLLAYSTVFYGQIDVLYDNTLQPQPSIIENVEFTDYAPLETINFKGFNLEEKDLKPEKKDFDFEAALQAEAIKSTQEYIKNNRTPTGFSTFAEAAKYNDLSIPDLIGVDQEPIYNQVKNNTLTTTSSYSNQDEETYRSSSYSGNNTTGEIPYGRYFFIGFLILVVFALGAVFGKRV